MTATTAVAAVDLGASGGRVMVGQVGPGSLDVRELHRFANAPVSVLGHLHTDILRLHAEMMVGLQAASRAVELASVGIDSWGVDYGLLDADGTLAGNPVHYRDARTEGVLPEILAKVSASELYAITGIQQLPINTLCQLVAAAGSSQLESARTLLLLPDLLGYWLTGSVGAEVTNASTTQLLDVRSRTWSTELMRRTGLDPGLFPSLRQPGDLVGGLLPEPATQAGLRAGLPVLAVGSHDTASAVACVPAADDAFAYISLGTWSLVGMELSQPVLTSASQQANFTNEAGLECTIRYLRNVMGLWLLQESLRAWDMAGQRAGLRRLLASAAREPALRFIVDVDHPAFLAPGDMPARISAACRAAGQAAPVSQAEVTRCIFDSMALGHRRAVADAQRLSGRHADVIHVVGGGARNPLLCQLTADACGLPVIAGPAEATAIGNVLVQAMALGAVADGRHGMRALVRATQPLRRYRPRGSTALWEAAERRVNVATRAALDYDLTRRNTANDTDSPGQRGRR
jgi:rhamnulokinase